MASAKVGPYGINIADSTFTGYERAAVRSATGNITVSKCSFAQKKTPAFELTDKVDQLVLVGNSFAGAFEVRGWEKDDSRIIREDKMAKSIPSISYSFSHSSKRMPAGTKIWDVCDFGAVCGGDEKPPAEDSTEAFHKALAAAGAAKGGTVYVPAGIYRIEGSLEVPTGVELRGSFEGAHYGNSTHRGTQLWVYGGKNSLAAPPLVTLRKGSGFKGFTVFYPEQGWTDGFRLQGFHRVLSRAGLDRLARRARGGPRQEVSAYGPHRIRMLGAQLHDRVLLERHRRDDGKERRSRGHRRDWRGPLVDA